MRVRALSQWLIISLLLFMLAGCGGGSSGTTPTPTPAPPGPPTSAAFLSNRALDGSDAANTNFTFNIWTVNVDGTSATPLTRLTAFGADSASSSWSPDGRRVVFHSQRALDGSDAVNSNGTTNIWAVNADGTGSAPLTHLMAANADNFAPVWSPDGRKIAFESSRALDGSDTANTNDVRNIWVVNADGTGPTPLTHLMAASVDNFAPVWSPDGRKIAFASTRALDGSDAINTNATLNIWIINADGTGATPLTTLTAMNAFSVDAVWSPDGSKLAFDSRRALDGSDAANTNNIRNIWVVNADGTNAVPLTKLTAVSADCILPAWSPDGGKIAFGLGRALDGGNAANVNDTLNIWTVNVDGTNATPLTLLMASGASSLEATWSPDGSKILFGSSRALDGGNAANINNTRNIWVMNADGSQPLPVTRITALSNTL